MCNWIGVLAGAPTVDRPPPLSVLMASVLMALHQHESTWTAADLTLRVSARSQGNWPSVGTH